MSVAARSASELAATGLVERTRPPPPALSLLPPPHPHPPMRRGPQRPVDREKTCPLLIRVFTKTGEHHCMTDYAEKGKVPTDEVQIYTWMDATLRELTDLVTEVAPEARRKNARLSFALVYPDRRGRNVIRTVGMTNANGVRRGSDDHLTLSAISFQTGDFLDVAIL
ncbi:hypothetical protein GOP47_0018448 [Adiantum capillus-veneris]|uniref:18 kDa Sin3-associated polypeptide n=1 Tax=Adiantum capillus-veneris TaxID=13818 RepID=A0A9D4UD66_ADICA|nr:hypothetical protein GOP47_0018448 [Adiantum capillus-veneris]